MDFGLCCRTRWVLHMWIVVLKYRSSVSVDQSEVLRTHTTNRGRRDGKEVIAFQQKSRED
jgi:hypothetical protein